MTPEQAAWAETWRERNATRYANSEKRSLVGLCGKAALEMKSVFPELRVASGFAVDKNGWGHEHWWLVAPDGSVVDPTASQFDVNGGVESYEEYDYRKHGPVRVGRCMNCGWDIMNDNELFLDVIARGGSHPPELCSRECEDSFARSLDWRNP